MDYTKLDPANWRPIIFEGVCFPPTVMGISVLSSILDDVEPELTGWLWSFPICRGVMKSAPSIECFERARRAIDLMLEQRAAVLAGIAERLGSEGFETHDTYRDWMVALQTIVELSARTEDDCEWSAPAVEGEAAIVTKQLDAMRRYLEGEK